MNLRIQLNPVFLTVLISILFSATSCSLHVEKRRYRKGYHVELSYHHNNKVQPINKSRINETSAIEPSSIKQSKTTELKDSLMKISSHPVELQTKIIPKKKPLPQLKQNQNRGDHCDIITFMDGTQQEIIVEEISETEVKYKKCSFKDGPSYRTSKANIKRIDMYNGEVYVPQNTGSRSSNGNISGQTIASLVLGIIALVCMIIGAFLLNLGGFLATVCLAPAGIFSLIGLTIGSTQLSKGAHPLAWIAFALCLLVQILAIVLTMLMFFL